MGAVGRWTFMHPSSQKLSGFDCVGGWVYKALLAALYLSALPALWMANLPK